MDGDTCIGNFRGLLKCTFMNASDIAQLVCLSCCDCALGVSPCVFSFSAGVVMRQFYTNMSLWRSIAEGNVTFEAKIRRTVAY